LRHHGSVGVFRLCSGPVVARDGIAFRGHAHRIVAAVAHGSLAARCTYEGRKRIILILIFISFELETIMWISL
jgi:hypothetical protein